MKKHLFGALALLSFVYITTVLSCKKDDKPTCTAGTGNVEIVVFALHNGDTIINSLQHPDTAWVKFGTTTSPGNSVSAYDKYYVSEENEDHIHLTNLSCGSYYIYRTAYDTVTHTRYTGSLGLNFTKTSGEVDTVIQVN